MNTLSNKYGEINADEIMFWDDRVENIAALKEFGINAQLYTNFENFKSVINNCGYHL
jgi:FMN phosphatase YigB (HAD superfamily)